MRLAVDVKVDGTRLLLDRRNAVMEAKIELIRKIAQALACDHADFIQEIELPYLEGGLLLRYEIDLVAAGETERIKRWAETNARHRADQYIGYMKDQLTPKAVDDFGNQIEVRT